MIISKMYHIKIENPYKNETPETVVKNFFETKQPQQHFEKLLDTYIVKKGDNLYKIAKNYLIENGRTASNKEIYSLIRKITVLNNIENPDKIFKGQKLHLDGLLGIKGESFIAPLKGRITSKFGIRLDPFTHSMKFHSGIDIAAPIGTPVRAAKSGKVIFSGYQEGYGNIVIIKHNNNVISKYAHNSKLLVKKGDYVKQGETISLVGSTGRSTGPHLHFEIRVNNKAVNPSTFVKV